MIRCLALIVGVMMLFSSALGCGEPKKDPTLKDKDRPKPAEKNQ